jgi:hypothetical protein
MSDDLKNMFLQKANAQRTNFTGLSRSSTGLGLMRKPSKPIPQNINTIKDEFNSLKEAGIAVQRIRLSIQQELEMVRKMRAEAVRYQQETATKARSEAHQLVLHARLETQREIEELIRQASEEIQKVLADMRVIRITAQEELAAQKKFTDAAKICSLSLAIKEDMEKPEKKKRNPLVTAKP